MFYNNFNQIWLLYIYFMWIKLHCCKLIFTWLSSSPNKFKSKFDLLNKCVLVFSSDFWVNNIPKSTFEGRGIVLVRHRSPNAFRGAPGSQHRQKINKQGFRIDPEIREKLTSLRAAPRSERSRSAPKEQRREVAGSSKPPP